MLGVRRQMSLRAIDVALLANGTLLILYVFAFGTVAAASFVNPYPVFQFFAPIIVGQAVIGAIIIKAFPSQRRRAFVALVLSVLVLLAAVGSWFDHQQQPNTQEKWSEVRWW